MTPLFVLLTSGLFALGAGTASAQSSLTVDQAIGGQVLVKSSELATILSAGMASITNRLGNRAIGSETGASPLVETGTEDLPAKDGLPAGQRTMTTTINSRLAGSRSFVNAKIRVTETRGGTVIHTAGTAEIEIALCPDADGQVDLKMDLSYGADNAISNAAGTGGTSANTRYKIKGTGQVSDDARLASTRLDGEVTTTTRGGLRPTIGSLAGQSLTDNSETTITFQMTTKDDGGIQSDDSISGRYRSTDSASDEHYQAFGKLVSDLARRFAVGAFGEAERLWRAGYCVEINVTPPAVKDGTAYTEPSQTLTFVASVRHKFEGTDLPVPIDVSLTGKEKASPDRIDTAPGPITFTSGPKRQDDGTIGMRTVSRRGIAEAKAKFDNARRMYELNLSVGPYFVIREKVCDITKPFEVRPRGEFRGVLVRFSPVSDSAGSFVEGGRAYGAQWNGSGQYTITWKDQITGRFVATNPNTARAGAGRSNNPKDMLTGTVERRLNSDEGPPCP